MLVKYYQATDTETLPIGFELGFDEVAVPTADPRNQTVVAALADIADGIGSDDDVDDVADDGTDSVEGTDDGANDAADAGYDDVVLADPLTVMQTDASITRGRLDVPVCARPPYRPVLVDVVREPVAA